MNSNHTNRNKIPLDFETERPSYKEKLPHFRSHLKIIKKPLTSSKHHSKKFNIDKLIKINQNKRPININIQNLNINNYNYYNGSQPILDFDQSEIEINVDVVNQNNYQERPQTSYGGIKDRKRKMKQSSKQVCVMKALFLTYIAK